MCVTALPVVSFRPTPSRIQKEGCKIQFWRHLTFVIDSQFSPELSPSSQAWHAELCTPVSSLDPDCYFTASSRCFQLISKQLEPIPICWIALCQDTGHSLFPLSRFHLANSSHGSAWLSCVLCGFSCLLQWGVSTSPPALSYSKLWIPSLWNKKWPRALYLFP